MRGIERTTQFKRDYKREMKGRHRTTLSGEWAGFRDCHVKPDLVLIYEKPDSDRCATLLPAVFRLLKTRARRASRSALAATVAATRHYIKSN